MKKIKSLVLILFFCLLPFALAEAATYWVSGTGGTATSSCSAAQSGSDPGVYLRQVNQGIACLNGGDTLHIKAGTYSEIILWKRWIDGSCESGYLCVPNGTPSKYTTISAAPGAERQVFLGNGSGNPVVGMYGRAEYIKFSGMVLDAMRSIQSIYGPAVGTACSYDGSFHCNEGPGGGKDSTEPRFITFENNEIKNANSSCVLGSANDVIFRFNNVHGCGIDGFDHGFYLGGDRILVENNESHNNFGNGIQVFTNVPMGEAPVFDSIVRNNYFHHNGGYAGTSVSGNHYFYNNASYRDGHGFQHNEERDPPGRAGTSYIYNNTIIEPQVVLGGVGGNGKVCAQRGESGWTSIIKNNLCVGGNFHDHTNGAVNFMGTDAENRNLHVLLSDFVNPTGGNFQLTSGTNPAVDQGLTLTPGANPPAGVNLSIDAANTARPQGAAWDAGACERFAGRACPNLTPTPAQPQPVVSITNPATDITTNQGTRVLSGTATAGTGSLVSPLTCSNNRGGTCTVSSTTSWTTNTLTLQPGANVITVMAQDTGGGTGSASRTITFTSLNALAITGPTKGPRFITTSASQSFTGTAACDIGVPDITVANNVGGGAKTTGTNWSASLTLTPNVINRITITNTCSTGGDLTALLDIAYSPPVSLLEMSFDENGGTAPADTSGLGNNGTLVGGVAYTSTAQKFGASALDFSGGSVTVTSTTLQQRIIGGFSIVAWIRPDTITSAMQAAVVNNYSQYLYASTHGPYACQAQTPLGGFESVTGPQIVCSTLPLPLNTYSCVALTYDGANLKMYVNKIEVQTKPMAYEFPISPATGTFQIGNSQYSEAPDAKIDEVRFKQYGMSAAEVGTACDTQIGPGPPAPASGLKIGSVGVRVGSEGIGIGF